MEYILQMCRINHLVEKEIIDHDCGSVGVSVDRNELEELAPSGAVQGSICSAGARGCSSVGVTYGRYRRQE
eukprot:COSAG02_NODE_2883_length_7817_cov_7.827805_3_plen_71_part_00